MTRVSSFCALTSSFASTVTRAVWEFASPQAKQQRRVTRFNQQLFAYDSARARTPIIMNGIMAAHACACACACVHKQISLRLCSLSRCVVCVCVCVQFARHSANRLRARKMTRAAACECDISRARAVSYLFSKCNHVARGLSASRVARSNARASLSHAMRSNRRKTKCCYSCSSISRCCCCRQ